MSHLERALGYALHRARLSIVQKIEEAFADHQITTTEFLALVVVGENPGISQADLAERLEVERPRIVPMLNKLEKRGLATRTVLAGDSRFRQLHLTKKGQHLTRVLERRAEELQRKAMARLNPAEASNLISSLWKLADRAPALNKPSGDGGSGHADAARRMTKAKASATPVRSPRNRRDEQPPPRSC